MDLYGDGGVIACQLLFVDKRGNYDHFRQGLSQSTHTSAVICNVSVI